MSRPTGPLLSASLARLTRLPAAPGLARSAFSLLLAAADHGAELLRLGRRPPPAGRTARAHRSPCARRTRRGRRRTAAPAPRPPDAASPSSTRTNSRCSTGIGCDRRPLVLLQIVEVFAELGVVVHLPGGQRRLVRRGRRVGAAWISAPEAAPPAAGGTGAPGAICRASSAGPTRNAGAVSEADPAPPVAPLLSSGAGSRCSAVPADAAAVVLVAAAAGGMGAGAGGAAGNSEPQATVPSSTRMSKASVPKVESRRMGRSFLPYGGTRPACTPRRQAPPGAGARAGPASRARECPSDRKGSGAGPASFLLLLTRPAPRRFPAGATSFAGDRAPAGVRVLDNSAKEEPARWVDFRQRRYAGC